MDIVKHCPNCGNILDSDEDFCTECGYDLKNNSSPQRVDEKSFFENLDDKTSFPIMVFSLIVFGAFLFIGSIFWSSFLGSGSIDLITYMLLTVIFAVFFGGIFVGYAGCKDKSYLVANFSVYMGSIFAVVLCGFGLIFSFVMGIFSAISSVFSSMGGSSLYGASYQSATPSYISNIDLSGFFKIILFLLLIPVAAYFGVYIGYFLKQNI